MDKFDKIKRIGIKKLSKYSGGLLFSSHVLVVNHTLDTWRELPEHFITDFRGMMYINKGTLEAGVNNYRIKISPGQMLVFNTGDMISHLVSEDSWGMLICISDSLSYECDIMNLFHKFSISHSEITVLPVSEISGRILEYYCEILKLKFQKGDTQINFTLSAILNEVFHDISNLPSYDNHTKNNSNTSVFNNFITLLMETFPKPREVKWYAEKLNVSPKHLSKICRQNSGKTAIKWITEGIIGDAYKFLSNPDIRIKEAAHLLGFKNNDFFCSFIKKRTGLTPLQVRDGLNRNYQTSGSPITSNC